MRNVYVTRLVPLSKTGAELLFEVISQRFDRGSIITTSNLPFDASRTTSVVLVPAGTDQTLLAFDGRKSSDQNVSPAPSSTV